jgi:oligosaccharyltransferase complex subunit delta (ribophorin II)
VLQGGELELTLLLGDPSAPKGVSAVLGTIELPEGASGAAPKPKLLTARHQPVSNIKQNIAHTFVSIT